MIRKTLLAAGAAVALLGAPMAQADATKNIVETAVEAGSFNTLLAAATAAGLAPTLTGEGPFTVFAPPDEAFAALPEGTVESLLLPENKDKLVEILTFHVVPAKVMAADLADRRTRVLTVQGDRLAVNGLNGVKVNGAEVVAANVEASNGVIHVIDKVLLPE